MNIVSIINCRRVLFSLGLSLLLAIGASSCSEEKLPARPAEGSIEYQGDVRVTVLNLSTIDADPVSPEGELTFQLINPKKDLSYTFKGVITFDHTISHYGETGAFQCRLQIGNLDIDDGEYYLTVSGEGLPEIGLRRVNFSQNIGTEISTPRMTYDDLEGSGTAESPYLINDAGDFLTMLWYLEEDPNHGYGYYFLQTSDFDLPYRSQIIDGHVWAATTFSGNYNGGGHTLRKLVYQGSSDESVDSNIGLFSDLIDATIENVTVSDVLISNACSNVGSISGSAFGTTTLRNITVSGTISASGSFVGGLLGTILGDIMIDGIKLNSLIVSTPSTTVCTGGLFGSFTGNKCNISNVSTPDHIFSITGGRYVGGLAGRIEEAKEIHATGITLEHSVDQESSSTKIIYGASSEVGGLFGELDFNGDTRITDISLKAPVRGSINIGGLIGNAMKVDAIYFNKAQLSSVVNGNENIGGFIGCLNSCGVVYFEGDDNTSRYVVKSSASAEVEGIRNVGGVIGMVINTPISVNTQVEIAVNVSGEEAVGGAFGFADGLNNHYFNGFNFSSTTMRVTASSQYAGGVIGVLARGNVHGYGQDFNLMAIMHPASYYKSDFSGVVKAGKVAGGIVGYCKGDLMQAASSASVTAENEIAGGIVGLAEGSVNYCTFMGTVSSKEYVGGVIGISDYPGTLSCLNNFADISTGRCQGGVVAYVRNGISGDSMTLDACFNAGNLTDGYEVGGVVGTFDQGKVKNTLVTRCGNVGNIVASGDSGTSVGGVIGNYRSLDFHVTGCSNNGDISSKQVQYTIGGVIGEVGGAGSLDFAVGEIAECMNGGTVSSKDFSTKLGGVVGHMHQCNSALTHPYTMIVNCHNMGNLPTDQKSDTGGILGFAGSYTGVYNCVNCGKISDGNAIIGTHTSGTILYHEHNYFLEGTGGSWPSSKSLSPTTYKMWSSYDDFDFTYVWEMTSDGPRLRNCPFQYDH